MDPEDRKAIQDFKELLERQVRKAKRAPQEQQERLGCKGPLG
jgi:hypothetical protein